MANTRNSELVTEKDCLIGLILVLSNLFLAGILSLWSPTQSLRLASELLTLLSRASSWYHAGSRTGQKLTFVLLRIIQCKPFPLGLLVFLVVLDIGPGKPLNRQAGSELYRQIARKTSLVYEDYALSFSSTP